MAVPSRAHCQKCQGFQCNRVSHLQTHAGIQRRKYARKPCIRQREKLMKVDTAIRNVKLYLGLVTSVS